MSKFNLVQIALIGLSLILFFFVTGHLKYVVVALLALALILHFWKAIVGWAKPELGTIEQDVKKKLS